MIDCLLPVLGRPQNAQKVVDSIRQNSSHVDEILFLCSPHDAEEVVACLQTDASVCIVNWPAGPGDWARKINLGFQLTDAEFLLLGADDLGFHPGWDDEVLRVGGTAAGVIGTNDLGNATVMRGKHSTHPVVRRSYIDEQGTIDEPGKVLHEGYQHQWCDTELVATAMARGKWAFAKNAIVEHLHPFWPDGHGGRKGEMDATYRKALSTPREDHRLFLQREHLWKAVTRQTSAV